MVEVVEVVARGCKLKEKEASTMPIPEEISRIVECMSPAMQEEVLRFAASLSLSSRDGLVAGEKGVHLLPFAKSLDADSAQEIREAIEAEFGAVGDVNSLRC